MARVLKTRKRLSAKEKSFLDWMAPLFNSLKQEAGKVLTDVARNSRKVRVMKKMVDHLIMLKDCKISLSDCVKQKLFSGPPLSRPDSSLFFNAVKVGDLKQVRDFLENDRFLIYVVDHVSKNHYILQKISQFLKFFKFLK